MKKIEEGSSNASFFVGNFFLALRFAIVSRSFRSSLQQLNWYSEDSSIATRHWLRIGIVSNWGSHSAHNIKHMFIWKLQSKCFNVANQVASRVAVSIKAAFVFRYGFVKFEIDVTDSGAATAMTLSQALLRLLVETIITGRGKCGSPGITGLILISQTSPRSHHSWCLP